MAYRILIVEDDPHIAELLDFTLRGSGHDPDIAAGAQAALERLAYRGAFE